MTNDVKTSGVTDSSQAVAGLLARAITALNLGQTQSAAVLLDQALELAPDNAEANRLMGIVALMTGTPSKGVDHLRSAFAQCPADATINMTLGSALIETGANEEGLTHLRRACELAPKNAEGWYNFGAALKFTSDIEQARDAFEHAVAINPGHIKARNKLTHVLAILGDTSAAVAMVRGTLSRQPDCADAWVALGNLKTEALTSDDVRRLQELLGHPTLSDDHRVALGFILAKALEDQSDYAAAFDTVSAANALKRRQVQWSRYEERARVDAIVQTFSTALPAAVDATLGAEVIFVVHVLRSGSTLAEQILASHRQVNGGDELQILPDILDEESARRGQPFPHWVADATSADWHRLGEEYMDRTRSLREQHPRFTDKTPRNWALVGAALAMLPGARVVNARRDPLETCFACYLQRFESGAQYTYDLDDMADYYAGYERLSKLWRQQFPQRYFDHSYEMLQKDTEGQIRRLLEFCDLPFDPACLAFHQTRRSVLTLSSAQVREPVQRNTSRSARYGPKLDALRAKLRAVGVPIAQV